MVCLHETMWEWCETRDWNGVGRGFLDEYLVITAVGRSGGVIIVWSEAMFTRVDAWTGQFSVGVKLKRRADAFEMVVALAFGLANATKRNDLWRELAGVVATFLVSLMLIGGAFNVTLEARDRPNDIRGWGSYSEEFWAFIAEAVLIEMGRVDCVYTWRSTTGQNLRSGLDRFLCSVELVEHFPLADVRSLPMSDHTPLVWTGNEGCKKVDLFQDG